MNTTPIEIDHAAAQRLWQEYAQARPGAAAADPSFTVEHFGDSPELAEELLDAVVSGAKRATSALVREFTAEGDPLPRIGAHWIACDGRGTPRVVLRTTELRIGDFSSVDERFAADEGEGDRTIENWRDGHRRYFSRVGSAWPTPWTENDDIVFERFRVVWPPDLADADGIA
ncbi:ASCH domain-containing protein [uncultured Microbacterium sp.]|uniref:ASCH domain-containing protein n=1 Tax=uncultured Microbacterium sp. TaxID=191216 RepID=UPI0025D597C7|nr:ASCH domain-containing protein [uncultured Microbacterium sp.]